METGGNQDQGGRMPEDLWPVIGQQSPVLVCDWLPRPHCSIPGRWGLQRGGWSQLWSDNGNINIAERGSADGRYIGRLLLKYPETEDVGTGVKRREGPAKLPQIQTQTPLQIYRGCLETWAQLGMNRINCQILPSQMARVNNR